MTTHVFHNETEWFVAETADEALTLSMNESGLTSEDMEDDPFFQLPDDSELTIIDVDDNQKFTKTCRQWADESEPGFLCSTEW